MDIIASYIDRLMLRAIASQTFLKPSGLMGLSTHPSC